MSGSQFTFFRRVLGFYLFCYFAYLFFYAPDLYSTAGAQGDHLQTPFLAGFGWLDNAGTLKGLFIFLGLLSVSLGIGYFQTICAGLILIFWVVLCLRLPNFFIASDGYIGWLLLTLILLPTKGQIEKNGVPEEFYQSAWIVLSVSYLFGGLIKIMSPSWVYGHAISHVLTSPMARFVVSESFTSGILFKVLTWIVVVTELLFVVSIFLKRTRKYFWLVMTFVHLGILLTVDIPSVSLGILIFHLFVLDPKWFPGFYQKTFGKLGVQS